MQNTSEEYFIYVGGLGDEIDTDDLEYAFDVFGHISYCEVVEQRGFGYISYFFKVDAANAIACMNGHILKNSRLETDWARNPPRNLHQNALNTHQSALNTHQSALNIHQSALNTHQSALNTHQNEFITRSSLFDRIFNTSSPDHRTVYCGGLGDDITYDVLASTFSPFGVIEEISNHFRFRGFTFVRYTTKEAATLAICEVDNTQIDGYMVTCNWSNWPDSSNSQHSQSEVIPNVTSDNSSASTTVPGNSTSSLASSKCTASAEASAKEDASKAAGKEKERNIDLLCKICMDNELGVVFQPCGHLTTCPKCAQQVYNCPVCRTRITSTVRAYLS